VQALKPEASPRAAPTAHRPGETRHTGHTQQEGQQLGTCAPVHTSALGGPHASALSGLHVHLQNCTCTYETRAWS